jgi:NAD(P)H-hydrate repair Nnr-like enzyme with NAD(P)H-hydrate epimerase domain
VEKSGVSAALLVRSWNRSSKPVVSVPVPEGLDPGRSRLKIATKARRIGYSFAAGYRLVRKCLNASASACCGMLRRVCAGRFLLLRGS